ncbi:hypothetical protein PO909_006790 [Leuciscus waleckii]
MTEPSDQNMDSASAASFEQMFAGNHARMDRQDEQIGASGRAIQALVTQVSELTSQLQRLRGPTAPAPPPPVPLENPNINRLEPCIPSPERYSGEPNMCQTFLTKCSIYFSLQPVTFSSEESKVALVMTLLSGRAALWGTAVWQNQHSCCSSFQALEQEIRRVFDRGVVGREAARQLADLRQNNNSVSDYSIQFRTLAAECKWNEEVQWDMFLHGLADRVQKEIYTLDLPKTLDELVELALRVDARLQQREHRPYPTPVVDFTEFPGPRGVNTVSPSNDPEPMRVGRARLSREEREQRRSRGLCLYCGEAGHFVSTCPFKRPSPAVGRRLLSGGISMTRPLNATFLPVRLQWADRSFEIRELPGITHVTGLITLITSGNHSERVSLYLTQSPHAPIVLGHPWLAKHGPRIEWGQNSEEPVNLSNVPPEYLDLKEVFSKSRAASLPPHRPYDCAIDLLPGYIVSSEGIRMDPEKVKAVVEWPSPDSRKALQRFLGFANFYRRFIHNFSQLAAPLTALTSPRTAFRWSDTAEAVFAKLKGRFVSAPILIAPDPSRQFVVEVDASEVGVGAVLSQRSLMDDKMHPCAFLSRRLSPAERNYDIGHTVVLTVVDRFSKAAHSIPLPKLPSAKETALTVVDHVFRLHGLPIDVVSDRGPQFVSKFWREFCKLLGATVSLSSGFHPQSNGQTERANQDLERVLRCLVPKNPSSWSQQLSMVEYAHNTLPVSSTGLSPFECSVGYQPPIFPSLESEVAVPSAHAFVQRCHRTWTRARETLLQVGARTKAKADRHRSKPPVYVVGQKVWLSTRNIPLHSVSNKLAPKFIGPFTVTKIISPVAVHLNLPPAYRRIHPVFHVSKVKSVFRSHINPPAPVLLFICLF